VTAAGERFDPARHEAVAYVESAAHDAQLDDAQHRNFGVLHGVENLEELVARRQRTIYHVAPGCERGNTCISASM